MRKCFRLTHYDITIYEHKLKGRNAMEIDVENDYLRAYVSYGKPIKKMWEANDRDGILLYLCHELAHCLTSQITDFIPKRKAKRALKTEEQVTEHISRVFYVAYVLYRKANNV